MSTLAANPIVSPPWPLAVGVILEAPDPQPRGRGERRLGLALEAYRLGYYLLDVIEVPASDGGGADRWAVVQGLVDRCLPDALVVARSEGAVALDEMPGALADLPLRWVAA